MNIFKWNKKEIKTEILEIDELKLPVKIYFENRRNSRISIGKKSINIRIPYFLNQAQREKEELKLKAWAEKKIKENIQKFKTKPAMEYKNNDVLEISNQKYILKIDYKDKKSSSARLMDNEIHLSISSNFSKETTNHHISTLLSRLIGQERLPELQKKIIELNKKYFNQNINKIAFKHQKTRWGSCSIKGNINISTRLLFAPDDVLEYVCIHELAHLICLNHSKKFWRLIANIMPDYKEKQKWLKENSDKYNF